jgi:hypothetical protein
MVMNFVSYKLCKLFVCLKCLKTFFVCIYQGWGVHVTGVSAAYTFKLNKNILSE